MIAGSAVGSSMCQTRRGKQIGHIRLDDDPLVFATQMARQSRGNFGIVERRFADAVLRAER